MTQTKPKASNSPEKQDSSKSKKKAVVKATTRKEIGIVSDLKKSDKARQLELEKKGNVTWEHNQRLIKDAIITLLREQNKFPSKSDIAKASGLSRQCVHDHMHNTTFDQYFKYSKEQLQPLTEEVILAATKQALNGSVRAQKLLMELMGWSPTLNLTLGAKQEYSPEELEKLRSEANLRNRNS